ncbi:hypothetical protein BS47DRAFT_1364719 [Hydnum rufescens UP504]|uniref:Uncharacterized protein n=1 Tax=Hydnum rufescens UP504 TaxID=1448309 RepID=A0A9P6DPN7_9AGAM|nr:hypothetical protein BS47DRAFT_1364719 [Hydnum rufescens UP504]
MAAVSRSLLRNYATSNIVESRNHTDGSPLRAYPKFWVNNTRYESGNHPWCQQLSFKTLETAGPKWDEKEIDQRFKTEGDIQLNKSTMGNHANQSIPPLPTETESLWERIVWSDEKKSTWRVQFASDNRINRSFLGAIFADRSDQNEEIFAKYFLEYGNSPI